MTKQPDRKDAGAGTNVPAPHSKPVASSIDSSLGHGMPKANPAKRSGTGRSEARVGRIAYINTLPFYHGLFAGTDSVSVVDGTPAQINGWMAGGELDFAPISSLEYALHPERYMILPNLCIGARDFSRSVLLISRERIEGLNGETIVLTEKSLSSQVLLRVLLKYKYVFENEFQVSAKPPDEMLADGKAALIIGDEALFYKPKAFVYKYDLSELWWDWSRRPFCFAVWAMRRAFYEENPGYAFHFYKQLKENAERNMQDIEKLIHEGLGLTIADERFTTVFGYLFNLNYHLDSEMIKGLELFYRLAARLDLAPKLDRVHFLEV